MFFVGKDENAEWIDTITFGDEDEEIADFNWDGGIKDTRLRPAVIDRFREIKFNRIHVRKKILKLTDEEIKFIITDNNSYKNYLLILNNPYFNTLKVS